MGYESARITVYATVSRHSSERDDRDDALVDELEKRIQAIVAEPKYRTINAWMD